MKWLIRVHAWESHVDAVIGSVPEECGELRYCGLVPRQVESLVLVHKAASCGELPAAFGE